MDNQVKIPQSMIEALDEAAFGDVWFTNINLDGTSRQINKPSDFTSSELAPHDVEAIITERLSVAAEYLSDDTTSEDVKHQLCDWLKLVSFNREQAATTDNFPNY